jgi:hypothetical protein
MPNCGNIESADASTVLERKTTARRATSNSEYPQIIRLQLLAVAIEEISENPTQTGRPRQLTRLLTAFLSDC